MLLMLSKPLHLKIGAGKNERILNATEAPSEKYFCFACTPSRHVIGIYKVHWMDNQTAPVDVLELVICDCKKGKCSEKMAMYLTTSFLY